jgi:predicted GTPase
MPYGDLEKQEVQRFATFDDLDKQKCTIEEREEYEPHIKKGAIVYAGVDYEKILRQAEKECDVVLWDGGNNDFSFYKPDLYITIADPHRPGHEITYHPGEVNFRLADVIIINKVNTAREEDIITIENNIKKYNPKAIVIKADLKLISQNKTDIKNKEVLVVEDGPTLTHGGMKYGAGAIYAEKQGAIMIDAEQFAVGSIKEVYKKYSHLKKILPAMGYGTKQVKELEQTINKTKCDYVVSGTPASLSKLIKINKPIIEVDYELEEKSGPALESIIKKVI